MQDQSPLPRSWRFLNAAARRLKAVNLPQARLDEQTLCQEAIKETGLTDFGDPYFYAGLRRLLDSAENEANLHFIGRFSMHNVVRMYLANRLLLAQAHQRTPELFQQPLLPPLIVLGLPRSGTTFLQRLLAADPAHRGVPMWELLRPLPGKKDRRRQRARRKLLLQQKANPQLDRIHYVRADEPEECMFLLGLTFDSLVFWVMAPVYGYLEWLQTQDHFQAYQEYRWLLHILQNVAPARRLTLKAPAHTLALEALLQAVPNALLVQTHRDPLTVCKSGASLIYSTQVRATDELDLPRMLEANFCLLEHMIASNQAARAAHPGRVLDVQYEQLVADPLGTVRGIYQHFELPWSEAHAERLRAYVRDNPRGKHGQHHYDAASLGLSDAAIARRLGQLIP